MNSLNDGAMNSPVRTITLNLGGSREKAVTFTPFERFGWGKIWLGSSEIVEAFTSFERYGWGRIWHDFMSPIDAKYRAVERCLYQLLSRILFLSLLSLIQSLLPSKEISWSARWNIILFALSLHIFRTLSSFCVNFSNGSDHFQQFVCVFCSSFIRTATH